MDIKQELQTLKIMKDRGILSEGDFENQKQALLNENTPKMKIQNFLIWKSYKDYWFQNAIFSGRTNRTEFFWVCLINAFLWFMVGFSVLYGFILQLDLNVLKGKVGSAVIVLLLWATFILPNAAIIVRRLHDTGCSGWLLVKIVCSALPMFFFETPLIFIPAMMATAVYSLLLLVRISLPGNRFKNRYGSPIFYMRSTLEEVWIYWLFVFIASLLFGIGYVNFTRINSYGLVLMLVGFVFFVVGSIQYKINRKKDIGNS